MQPRVRDTSDTLPPLFNHLSIVGHYSRPLDVAMRIKLNSELLSTSLQILGGSFTFWPTRSHDHTHVYSRAQCSPLLSR